MVDVYKIAVWAKSREESLEEQVNRAYRILNKLKEYKLFDVLLLPAESKEKVKEFELSKENIKELILNKQDKQFPDIGTTLLFFTSLVDGESTSIIISVGIYSNRLKNTMTISLPVNFTSSQLIGCIGLLKDLFQVYEASYAFFTSNMNLELYDKWYDNDNKIPKVVFWVNYWGNDMVNKLKVDDKLLEAVYEYEITKDGCYVRTQKEPIDVLNQKHIELQKKLNRLLEL